MIKETNGPDFLGIGSSRCGTSWLYRMLSESSYFWVPPIKELHYFDRSRQYPSPSYLADASPLFRLISPARNNLHYKRYLIRSVGKFILKRDISRIQWGLMYFLGRIGDQWYRNLFPVQTGENLLRGEITPAYALLDETDINKVKKINPGMKIIFLMRNPVARAWSQAVHSGFAGKEDIESYSVQQFTQWLSKGSVKRKNEFMRTIRAWETIFSSDQMFVGFYEEISHAPETLLRNIFRFLGIFDFDLDPGLFKLRINANPKLEMPKAFKYAANLAFEKEIHAVAKHYGGFANEWLQNLEAGD